MDTGLCADCLPACTIVLFWCDNQCSVCLYSLHPHSWNFSLIATQEIPWYQVSLTLVTNKNRLSISLLSILIIQSSAGLPKMPKPEACKQPGKHSSMSTFKQKIYPNNVLSAGLVSLFSQGSNNNLYSKICFRLELPVAWTG